VNCAFQYIKICNSVVVFAVVLLLFCDSFCGFCGGFVVVSKTMQSLFGSVEGFTVPWRFLFLFLLCCCVVVGLLFVVGSFVVGLW